MTMQMLKVTSDQLPLAGRLIAACGFAVLGAQFLSTRAQAQERVYEQIIARKNPTADVRIAYGKEPQQFGELWLPKGQTGKSPLIILVHGEGTFINQEDDKDPR